MPHFIPFSAMPPYNGYLSRYQKNKEGMILKCWHFHWRDLSNGGKFFMKSYFNVISGFKKKNWLRASGTHKIFWSDLVKLVLIMKRSNMKSEKKLWPKCVCSFNEVRGAYVSKYLAREEFTFQFLLKERLTTDSWPNDL